jgi:hypothetical protein
LCNQAKNYIAQASPGTLLSIPLRLVGSAYSLMVITSPSSSQALHTSDLLPKPLRAQNKMRGHLVRMSNHLESVLNKFIAVVLSPAALLYPCSLSALLHCSTCLPKPLLGQRRVYRTHGIIIGQLWCDLIKCSASFTTSSVSHYPHLPSIHSPIHPQHSILFFVISRVPIRLLYTITMIVYY